MQARPPVPAGVLLYPKPSGPTSHDVVAGVRRRLREELRGRLDAAGRTRLRVGHAGTLDPFATGLLLVLVGRATRVQRFLTTLPKTYRAVARLGWRSDTGDRDGELEETGLVPERLELPVGEVWQRPPAYSAVKVRGERLYERARRGDPEEGEARRVTVHRADVLWRRGDRAGIEIECSSGTYVRQLVAALGDAYCEELERVRIGPFGLDDADPERIVPLEEALAFLPERAIGASDAERVSHGVPLRGDGGRQAADGEDTVLRLTHGGRVVALAERRGETVAPVVVLAR